jgi:hypothetical protein
MARRFGSAMISNVDSTLFVYLQTHIPVKAYNKYIEKSLIYAVFNLGADSEVADNPPAPAQRRRGSLTTARVLRRPLQVSGENFRLTLLFIVL